MGFFTDLLGIDHIPYNDPADDYDYGHSDEFFEDYEPSDYDDYDDDY
jgi:hypothetical protein